jgi:hypothetical protein
LRPARPCDKELDETFPLAWPLPHWLAAFPAERKNPANVNALHFSYMMPCLQKELSNQYIHTTTGRRK